MPTLAQIELTTTHKKEEDRCSLIEMARDHNYVLTKKRKDAHK